MIFQHFEVLLPLELMSLSQLVVCSLQELDPLVEDYELLRVLEGREVMSIIMDVRA